MQRPDRNEREPASSYHGPVSNVERTTRFGGTLTSVLGLLSWLLGVSFVAWLFLRLHSDPSDVLRAYPSPERHANVDVLDRSPSFPLAKKDVGDFDGDGVLDTMAVDYFHMEPLLSPSSSGLLRVHSGLDGRELLVHAVASPFTPCAWLQDIDGNGTDDLVVEAQPGRFVALGWTR